MRTPGWPADCKNDLTMSPILNIHLQIVAYTENEVSFYLTKLFGNYFVGFSNMKILLFTSNIIWQ
jgi:hypothetical protein